MAEDSSGCAASLAFAQKQKSCFEQELFDFLRIASISADSRYEKQVGQASDYVAEELKEAGLLSVRVYQTKKHPIVFGERLVKQTAPTVLIYGHYDVQPVDPLSLWKRDPFDPVVIGGRVYARGASDDKGQLSLHLKALKSIIHATGSLPVNVKVIVEGEEEIGSPSLLPFIKAHKKKLKSDILLISDTEMAGEGLPGLTSSLRGLVYLEVRLRTGARDLHSGVYGGGTLGAGELLMKLLTMLKPTKEERAGKMEEMGELKINGLYRDVRLLTKPEQAELDELPFDGARVKKELGIPIFSYEAMAGGAATTKSPFFLHTTAQPSLEISGFVSGYTGEGAKTIIPAVAMAKLGMRLVSHQDPDHAEKCLRRQILNNLKQVLPRGWKHVSCEFENFGKARPVETKRGSAFAAAALSSLEAVYGKKAYMLRSGGSIPIVADFVRELGVEPILMGFGLKKDAIHSPNESFSLRDFHRGIVSSIRFLYSLPSEIAD